MTSLRIGIGGIRYETNSFADGVAARASFALNYIRTGDEVLLAEANTEVAGAVAAAHGRDVTLVGLLDTFGGCGPVVDHAVYLDLKQAYIAQLEVQEEPLDALYVVLHGAMATTECRDVEADLVSAIRQTVGPLTPLIVSQDLHGAPSSRLLEACNALIGFKTCPHTDYEQTGAKALQIAIDTARGHIRPMNLRHKIPMLTPAEGHDTSTGPMSEPMKQIQAEAREHGLIDESLFMCQPWLDAERSGWCLTAVVDAGSDRAVIEHLLAEQARRLWASRKTFLVSKVSVAQAMTELVAADPGVPVILAEGGDSPSAGSTGDSTDLLSAIVALEDPRPRLAIIADPAAAAELCAAGVGAMLTVRVGGALTPRFADAFELTGVVTAVSNGRYIAQYPAGPTDIGVTASLQVGPTTVVVTSRSAMMLDQEAYRHLGLDPSAMGAIQVKSAGGFRALWSAITSRVITVDARGASDSNLARLPFAFAPADTWPLSEIDPGTELRKKE